MDAHVKKMIIFASALRFDTKLHVYCQIFPLLIARNTNPIWLNIVLGHP